MRKAGSFLSAGLKYHDTTVSTRSSNEGNSSLTELPDAICENIAPDIIKKNPAYAHSFSKGSLGISNATTPKIFQTPSIVRK
jgi:hypothetical protein